jgi:hypothetical protein
VDRPDNRPAETTALTEQLPPAGAGTPLYDALIAADRGSFSSPATEVTGTCSGAAAAVVDLFARIKAIEQRTGDWRGGDVVDVLGAWFTEFGIDIDADEVTAATVLRVPARLAHDLLEPTRDDTCLVVHVRTGASDPLARVLPHLRALTADLGENAATAVYDITGDQIAHLLHPGLPDSAP